MTSLDLSLKDIIAATALVVSGFSLHYARKISVKNYDKIAAIKRFDHALEINKILLANEDLISVYDDYKPKSPVIDEAKLSCRSEALFDFFLLTWENVCTDFPKRTGEDWEAWENSMDELFVRSTMFRAHVQKVIESRPVFPLWFVKFLNEKLKKTSKYK